MLSGKAVSLFSILETVRIYSFSSNEATCFKICCNVDSLVSGSGVGSGSGSFGCVVFVKPFNPAFCIIVG